MGLQAEEDDTVPSEPVEFHLWPENMAVWSLWHRCQTLWRVGMNGRDGLDYAGLCAYLRQVERIKPRRFAEVFTCLQAMECAALQEWAKLRKENESKG